MSEISVFSYTDYRLFLKDAFSYRKKTERKFSLRAFSKEAGFKSQSVFKLVIENKMNLSEHSIFVFAKVFKLNNRETDFFFHLVKMNQAKESTERAFHAEAIAKSKDFRKLNPLSTIQLNYYKFWYYIPIRELVALDNFIPDAHWISQNLNPKITPAEAQRALDDLVELGLVVKNKNGKLTQNSRNVSTGGEVISKTVANYHKEMLTKAYEAVDRFKIQERDITSATIPIRAKDFAVLQEKVRKFRKELLEWATEGQDHNQVMQINFQLFPLTDIIEDKGPHEDK